jgi:hypothetical protein
MDLDHRALGNAGVWAIGRLQTDADRERVVDGLGVSPGRAPNSPQHPDSVLQKLPPRCFLVRNVHEKGDGVSLLRPRTRPRGCGAAVGIQRDGVVDGRPSVIAKPVSDAPLPRAS